MAGSTPKKIILIALLCVVIGTVIFKVFPILHWGLLQSLAIAAPPEHPDDVPRTAIWAGGVDGGAFIDCIPSDSDTGCYDCAIYFDQTGDLWESGTYCSDSGVVSSDSLPLLLSGFNGRWIYLKNGLRLEPMVQLNEIDADE